MRQPGHSSRGAHLELLGRTLIGRFAYLPVVQSLFGAGLTKVPIDGQPKSIVRDLEDMARTYIKVGSPPRQLWVCRSSAGTGSAHAHTPNLTG